MQFWFYIGIATILFVIVLLRETRPKNTIVTAKQYWPPKNLSSADVGYIYNETVNTSDIVSLIPYFANKGLLTIDTTSGHVILHKTGNIDKTAPEYQQKFLDGFFADGDTFDTEKPTKHFSGRWRQLLPAIYRSNKDYTTKYPWSGLRKKWEQTLSNILGLKEFIENPDKTILESLSRENENYFYAILPYAVAFDLQDTWAQHFENINVKPVKWYKGTDNTPKGLCSWMNVQNLYTPAMANSVNSLTAACATEDSEFGLHSLGGRSGRFAAAPFAGYVPKQRTKLS